MTGRRDSGAHYADAADLAGTVRRQAADVARLGFDEVFNRMLHVDPAPIRGRLSGRGTSTLLTWRPKMSRAMSRAIEQPQGLTSSRACWPRLAVDLPVRLRGWDGSEAGPASGPVWWPGPRGAQPVLWHPGELGLARAYVSGDLDVEGDLADGLRRVHAAAPASGPFGVRVWLPSPPRPASACSPRPPNLPAASSGSAAAGTAGPATRRLIACRLRRAVRVLPAHPGSQHGLLVRVLGRPEGSQRSAAGST